VQQSFNDSSSSLTTVMYPTIQPRLELWPLSRTLDPPSAKIFAARLAAYRPRCLVMKGREGISWWESSLSCLIRSSYTLLCQVFFFFILIILQTVGLLER
jgi:hypothetical protein